MSEDLFSVPIFFIVFRETVEAAIIVSVLLSFVEQLMSTGRLSPSGSVPSVHGAESSMLLDNSLPQDSTRSDGTSENNEKGEERVRKLIRRMRIQIWAGTLSGFFIALAIGAAFIAVFYTKLVDLWGQTEQIWEGVFSIIACIIIYLMGIAFLKMDRSRIKWRLRLAAAFEKSHTKALKAQRAKDGQLKMDEFDQREGRGGKWALFLLPFITVLREGLEAVVFVGGVSLNVGAKSIPIPVVVGLIAGGIVGYLIYRTGSTTSLHWFLIGSTCFLFLIGAGLASKGVGFFQYYYFAQGVGGDVSETGDGPGSFQVAGNVWHLPYGNPETGSPSTNGGWQVFNAIFGWNNTATIGTILTYIFYWLLVAATLIYLKWKEGRAACFGVRSKAAKERDEKKSIGYDEDEGTSARATADGSSGSSPKAPMESPDIKKVLESPTMERGAAVLNIRD